MVEQKSKADIIAERQANLELPEEPPVKSDWNSASTKINVTADERQEELPAGKDDAVSDNPSKPSGVRVEDGADLSGVGRK